MFFNSRYWGNPADPRGSRRDQIAECAQARFTEAEAKRRRRGAWLRELVRRGGFGKMAQEAAIAASATQVP
jgi:D-alanyl-D-alanine dipeptidase